MKKSGKRKKKKKLSEDVNYRCEICKKPFATEDPFKAHLRLHKGLPRYSCELCDKTFEEKNKYEYHMKNHKGERNWKCSICDKGFLIEWDLELHMRTHTDYRPYICEICGRAFKVYCHLSEHRETHNETNVFECVVCKARLHTSKTLRGHMASTHKIGNLRHCKLCNRSFVRLNRWKLHMNKHHPNVAISDAEVTFAEKRFKKPQVPTIQMETPATSQKPVMKLKKRTFEKSTEDEANIPEKLRRCNAVLGQRNLQNENTPPSDFNFDNFVGNINERFDSFRNLIENQNSIITNILAEHTVLLKSLVKNEEAAVESMKFPIQTIMELTEFEKSIDADNMDTYITAVHNLVHPGGLVKNLKKILDEEIVINFNFDGVHGKSSFKEYKNLNIVLRRAFEKNNNGQQYETEIRRAFKAFKNRYFKNICIKKKLSKETK